MPEISFKVVVEPSLGEPRTVLHDFDFTAVDIEQTLEENDHLYDVQFVLGNESFGYWPDSIIMALDTIVSELKKLRAGSCHAVEIMGYGVLLAKVKKDRVILFDAANFGDLRRRRKIGYVSLAYMVSQLEHTASALWEMTVLRTP